MSNFQIDKERLAAVRSNCLSGCHFKAQQKEGKKENTAKHYSNDFNAFFSSSQEISDEIAEL